MPSHDPVIARLLGWCELNGIWIDQRLQVQRWDKSHEDGDVSKGICVFSGENYILPSTTLVKIPRDSVISIRTCSLKDHIPFVPCGLGAQLVLSLALYVEILKARSSRWHGYIQSFPDGIVDLPIFWGLSSNLSAIIAEEARVPGVDDGHEALLWLRGTEAGSALQAPTENDSTLLDEITIFFERTARPLLLEHVEVWQINSSATPQLEGFYGAFSLVSSRAFLVDAYHGLSMVPIADAFNHVVENHVHLESDYNVCPECGSLYECAHDRDHDSIYVKDDFTVEDDDEYFEMVSNAPIPARSEVYNTYGESLPNAELLKQYGFILDVNDNDCLCWAPRIIVELLTPDAPAALRSTILDTWDSLSILSDTVDQSDLLYDESPDDHMVYLNGEGQVSGQLWVLLAVVDILSNSHSGFLPQDVTKELLERLLFSQIIVEALVFDEVEDDLEHLQEHPEDLRVILSIAKFIVKLCDARKMASGRPGSAEFDLGLFLEDLPQSRKRTRLAVSILMTERSILDSCRARWTTVINVQSQQINGLDTSV